LTSTASPTVVEFQENMKLVAGILHSKYHVQIHHTPETKDDNTVILHTYTNIDILYNVKK